MPNGRSGGFLLETSELRRLVGQASVELPSTMLVDDSGPRPRETDSKELLGLIEKCPFERVAVEEQDHSTYIVHLRNDPTPIWIVVFSKSPLLADLKQRHARWMVEHPNWNGWIAF